MEVVPPRILRTPLKVPSKLLMGPGPSNCSPRVLHAMGQPILGHLHPETLKMLDEVKEGIRYIFQTRNDLTLAVSTSGHGGMEAVMCNLLEPNDKALVAVNGIWGQRAADMAKRYGATVYTVQVPLGENFSHSLLESEIAKHRPKILFIVQGESSTGVFQPLENLGDVCHRNGCLLAVDAVASLGGVELYTDRWGIDVVYTGSQKVLGAAPGLTPISFSSKAQNIIVNRKTPVKVFYWDMTLIGDYWNCFGRPRFYHHTISLTLLYGLREALAIITEEGLQNVIKRHQACAQRLYEGLERMDLKLFVQDPQKRLSTVTSIRVTKNLKWKQIIEYAMKTYNVEISGGLGDTVNKVMRIGLMGYNATFENVDLVLKIFKEALLKSNHASHL